MRWSTAFVEPPEAETYRIPFSRLARVKKSRKGLFRRVRSQIRSPTSRAWRTLAASNASIVDDPKGASPAASRKQPMVLAVPIIEQVPAVAQNRSCQTRKVSWSIFPELRPPIASFRSGVVITFPPIRQGIIAPAVRKRVGRFSRTAAISIPGKILSQEPRNTSPSNPCAPTIASIDPAIKSRWGRM